MENPRIPTHVLIKGQKETHLFRLALLGLTRILLMSADIVYI